VEQSKETPENGPVQTRFVVGFAASDSQDSYIEPIARFTGTSWVNTWPKPEDGLGSRPAPPLSDLPNAWLGRPIPLDWAVWSADGDVHPVHVVGTRRGNSCFALIQLTLSQGTQIGSKMYDSRVAVDTDQRVGGFRTITNSDPEWQRLSAFIQGAWTDNEESVRITNPREISPAELKNVDIHIEYLVQPQSATAPLLYYFEASKEIRKADGENTGLVIRGWIGRDNSGNLILDHFDSRGMDRDKPPIPQEVPLGSFHLGGREYFVTDIRGYEGSAANILEATRAGIVPVLEVGRAGC
jgi:hypothetical protein